MDDSALTRVVFYDPSYSGDSVHFPEGIAGHLVQRHGFVVLDAQRLGAWMRSQTERGSAPATVCLLAMGIIPDTIAESASTSCTARRYLDAGGRLVWIGHMPFRFQGRSEGPGLGKAWGHAQHKSALGVQLIFNSQRPPEPTPAGKAWGLVLTDKGDWCAVAGDVTPLTLDGNYAGSWHKVYNPAHPLQGFLRYRGGSFDATYWNAKCNELYRLTLRGFEEPFKAPESWRDAASERIGRVVFSDPRYPASWSPDAEASAERLCAAHAFVKRDADALARWMRARVAGGAEGSVCVVLHGVAPDTIFDRITPQCLARRYMDAGGRLVWAGDVPFFYQGRKDGSQSFHNDAGTHEAVLDIPVRWDWEVGLPPAITPAGKAWGMTTPDESLRFVDASAVTEVLAGSGPFASTWLKTFKADAPGSGFLRFRGGAFAGPAQADELAAVAVHGLPAPQPEREPDALPVAVEGTRVGEGSFVVDRKRALDKLMRFMLPSAELFILPLARAAAAAGAKSMRVIWGGGRLTVGISEGNFPLEIMRDPLRAVLDEAAGAVGRGLGLAVLTALRAEPKAILVGCSGGGARVLSPSEQEAWADGTNQPGLVEFIIDEPGRLDAVAVAGFLRDRAPGVPFQVESAAEAAPPHKGLELPFDDGVLRGVLRMPERPSLVSSLDVCIFGVTAGPASLVLPGVQVEGWVNDDRLTLNASQTGVVRDERWEALAPALAEKAQQLALAAADLLGRDPATWSDRLGLAGFSDLWRLAVAPAGAGLLSRGMAAATSFIQDGAQKESLAREARAARWLREAAGRLLHGLEADSGDPLLRALWKTPLFLTVQGGPVSLEELELSRRADGMVRTASHFAPGRALSLPVVWLEAPSEAALLRRLFGDAVRDVSAGLDALEVAHARSLAGAGSLLDRAGATGLLSRGTFPNGEVGLRLEVPGGGARLYGFQGIRPLAYDTLPGPLRFDAAVEGPPAAVVAAAAVAAAEVLYRGLASELHCPVAFGFIAKLHGAWKKRGAPPASAREKAAIEHLRDYLVWSLDPARAAGREWARGVPLFDSSDGWLSYDDLAGRLAEDGLLLVADNNWTTQFKVGSTTLVGRHETPARLRTLFSGLASKEDPYCEVFFRAPAKPTCIHRAPFGCLVEGELAGRRIHLAVGADGGALAYPLEGGDSFAVSIVAAGSLAVEAAVAILARAPRAVAPGEHPWRRFVLATAKAFLAPWPGGPGMGLFLELLQTTKLLRGSYGEKTLIELMAGWRSAWVHYAPADKPGSLASFILGAEELETIRALWPEDSKRLLTEEEKTVLAKRLPDGEGLSREAILKARTPPAARAAVVRRAVTDPVGGAKDLLSDLAGRQGLALFWRDAKDIRGVRGKGKSVMSQPNPGTWTLDLAHPFVERVLASGLPTELQAAYLASLVHTSANRMMARVTDKDDGLFHEALADWAANSDDDAGGL